ncbi:alpha-glucan family phosphorylase [Candidatus Latescibacterota bacterium]
MKPVKSFIVKASLPKPLEPLRELVFNLAWSWNPQAVNLFYRLDRKLWEETYHNPVNIIGRISQDRLDSLEKDEGIITQLARIRDQHEKYLKGSSWYSKNIEKTEEKSIAYFSLEFGLVECLPIYSGGLGILAGDHLKSASDLGIPLVGVGLLYQEGFFRQYLNSDGWQQESYTDNDFYNIPVTPVIDKDGTDLKVEVDFPDGQVFAKVWQIQVGRVPLYLLDTNIAENSPDKRVITVSLYGGDSEMRIRQEILLSIGGVRALHAMDIWPTVFHMNEGHVAFLALERIRVLMEQKHLTFAEAQVLASAGNVFTTHTPVPAGHDRFSPELMKKYFARFAQELGLTIEEFLRQGRINPKSPTEDFCMTVLALKCADKTNAVSLLHMNVSKDMWKDLYAGFPVNEVPISHITNGIHLASWVSNDMVDLFERYLGPRWRTEPASSEIWNRVNDIPEEEIWRTHEIRRERLVTFARHRLQAQMKRRGASEVEINTAAGVLNSKALTIGLARRFATYKRIDLIFRDPERLARILKSPDRPVQIIIAGKAHPHDDQGKAIIRKIVHYTRRYDVRSHIVFVEDYDINVARYLVQGADVWLNTPRRPLEASGTSGMKAAANGALNLSVLDGWWDEGYAIDVGWSIGSGEVYANPDYQDEVESEALYTILEQDIVPLFYETGEGDLPRRWIRKMKSSMSRLVPFFNTHRMVHEYFSNCYQPAIKRFKKLEQDNAQLTRDFSIWRQYISENWDAVAIKNVESADGGIYTVGSSQIITATIKLGKLKPEDVRVELYAGAVDANESLVDAVPIRMKFKGKNRDNYVFEGEMPFTRSGRMGFSLRVIPSHPIEATYQDHMLIKWA